MTTRIPINRIIYINIVVVIGLWNLLITDLIIRNLIEKPVDESVEFSVDEFLQIVDKVFYRSYPQEFHRVIHRGCG
jgi:hypothetical protein